MLRMLLFVTGSASIGFILYTFFYWRQMHAIVHFEDRLQLNQKTRITVF